MSNREDLQFTSNLEAYNKQEPIISIEQYRRLLNDYQSSEEKILKRLRFLEALCRNVIKTELKIQHVRTK